MHRVHKISDHVTAAEATCFAAPRLRFGTCSSSAKVEGISKNSLVGGELWCGSESQVKRNGDAISSVTTFVKYYSGPVRSMEPTGTIYFSTDPSGNQVGMKSEGVELKQTEITVHNARDMLDSLDAKAFSLQQYPTALAYSDFFFHAKVVSVYYHECEELLRKTIGAACVLPFDYIVRGMQKKKEGKMIVGGPGQGVQGGATFVHADYTMNGAPRRLEQLAKAPLTNDVRLGSLSAADLERAHSGRWCIINVWRNIRDEPVEKTPLALCDATTVFDQDLCCLEQRFVDRTGENYMAAYNPRHMWYYYPQMVRDEALLIKTWDSKKDAIAVSDRFTLHTAFADASSPEGAPDRESIEVRCVCIY